MTREIKGVKMKTHAPWIKTHENRTPVELTRIIAERVLKNDFPSSRDERFRIVEGFPELKDIHRSIWPGDYAFEPERMKAMEAMK